MSSSALVELAPAPSPVLVPGISPARPARLDLLRLPRLLLFLLLLVLGLRVLLVLQHQLQAPPPPPPPPIPPMPHRCSWRGTHAALVLSLLAAARVRRTDRPSARRNSLACRAQRAWPLTYRPVSQRSGNLY